MQPLAFHHSAREGYVASCTQFCARACVRVCVAQVRASDWKELSQAQAAAAAAGQPLEAMSWQRYERHALRHVKALLEQLPQVGGRQVLLGGVVVQPSKGQIHGRYTCWAEGEGG